MKIVSHQKTLAVPVPNRVRNHVPNRVPRRTDTATSAPFGQMQATANGSAAVRGLRAIQQVADGSGQVVGSQALQASADAAVLQRKPVRVNGGSFDAKGFEPFSDGSQVVGMGGGASATSKVGAAMGALLFRPDADVDATEVHLVQTVREIRSDAGGDKAAEKQANIGYEDRLVPDGPHAGWGIDAEPKASFDAGFRKIVKARAETGPEAYDKDIPKSRFITKNKDGLVTSRDPRYAQQRLSADTPAYAPEKPPTSATTGYATLKKSGKWVPEAAMLRDQPSVPVTSAVIGMDFEVVALATGGKADGTYLGAVTWGWHREAGKTAVTLVPVTLKSMGDPSEAFLAAAAVWNRLEVGGAGMMPLPIPQTG